MQPATSSFVLETDRLALRKLALDDAGFILDLLNDPAFLRYVGDKGVRTQEEACRYILDGPVDSYERFGFGLYLVTVKETGARIGICGLLKRETLPDVDVGFAFLPAFRSKGYATESASAVVAYGRDVLGLRRLVAITTPDNDGSMRVLEKIGFRFERMIRLTDEGSPLTLFASER
jgi:ribosomal-protein-alanine N-acetyltransferase